MDSVSFIIPHKGRENMLIETIDSIAALEYPHEQLEIVLDDLKDVEITDAKVFDNVASVAVRYQSTQTRTLTDADGNSIVDEDTGTRDLIDIWTFERDLTLDDPNWKLAETDSPDED